MIRCPICHEAASARDPLYNFELTLRALGYLTRLAHPHCVTDHAESVRKVAMKRGLSVEQIVRDGGA